MVVVVTGVGFRSALGCLEDTWKNLLAGRTGIRFHQPFPELPSLPLGMIGDRPTDIQSLTRCVVEDALRDANLSPPLLDCGIVIGSSRGNQAEWESFARKKPWLLSSRSPASSTLSIWLHTLPHVAATTAAQWVGSTAPVLSPMAACATGVWAIAQGYELVRSGQCQRVLAGAVEAPITPLTLTGFERMGALAKRGAFPFDRQREGLVLGEGGAVLVLETAELAEARGVKIYGRILGAGLTADGYHVSAPKPGSGGAIAAVRTCVQRSGLLPESIDFIHTHGTATRLNDQNEANLIQSLFPAEVAICSSKGATGHTIGASGALGVALCLMALQHQLLPPCVGLREAEFDLNFVIQPTPTAANHALCLSFGFGGQNGAIALNRWSS
jgi:3-oxoacyl-[acyl-carrier-protein] synthase II